MKILTLYILFLCIFNINIKNYTEIKNSEYINKRIYSFNRGLDTFFFNTQINIYINITPNIIKAKINEYFNDMELIQNMPFIFLYTKKNINTLNSKIKINKEYIKIEKYILIKKNFNIYTILPIIGPGTFKTHIILFIKQIFNPFLYFSNSIFLYYILYIINKKSHLMYDVNFFHTNMIDGYSFLKDIFIQNKIKKQNENDFLKEPD